jgi:hypothetical protein
MYMKLPELFVQLPGWWTTGGLRLARPTQAPTVELQRGMTQRNTLEFLPSTRAATT